MSKEFNKSITESDLRIFFGNNADTYIDYWKAVVHKQKDVKYKKWHWSAFFMTVLWLAYRKLYFIAAMVIAFVIGFTLIESYFELELLTALDRAINIGISAALALYARQIAVTAAMNRINKINHLELTAIQREDMIRKAGGTSIIAPVALVASFVLFLAILIYFEI